MNRRDALASLGAAAGIGVMAPLPDTLSPIPAVGPLPAKADFRITPGYTYINGAYTHPMPIVSGEAARQFAESRATLAPAVAGAAPAPDPKALFAKLINAKPTEISYVPNTSTGENLVLNGLGITRNDGNVVTDALHFEGALLHLEALKSKGLDVRIAPMRDYRIDMRDMEKLVDRKTKLIQISLVAMYNGFQHDLKTVCDLAHANGALVYADIVQAAGAVPIDVRATGLDFAACSSFKWLMGDFGLGFLFASERALERIERSQWGYHSAATMEQHFPPFDPNATSNPLEWTPVNDASGKFEVGSIGGSVKASVAASLEYILKMGVDNIQSHRQPLLAKMRAELPKHGFTCVTPAGTTSPIITFATRDGDAVQRTLQAAKVNVRVTKYWMRLSPSVYNDMADIDRLVQALS